MTASQDALVFEDLDSLEHPRWVFCRTPFNWELSDVSRDESGVMFGGGRPQK